MHKQTFTSSEGEGGVEERGKREEEDAVVT